MYKRQVHRWCGEASIERGTGFLSKLMGAIAGFPPAGKHVVVEVEMRRTRNGETWIRTFGGRTFRSHLSLGRHHARTVLVERFGALSFSIALESNGTQLEFPVVQGRLLGLPLPRTLLPRSVTRETIDGNGRACFDVRIMSPFGGLVVHYQGSLEPDICAP